MKEKKLTQQELAEIRLTTSKSVIGTFRDLEDLKEIKRWADEQIKDHQILLDYIEKIRMMSLEKGKGDLWEEWKKDNKMSYLGFQTLNDLEADLTSK